LRGDELRTAGAAGLLALGGLVLEGDRYLRHPPIVSLIPDPRSPIPDPRSPIPDPRSPIPDPQSDGLSPRCPPTHPIGRPWNGRRSFARSSAPNAPSSFPPPCSSWRITSHCRRWSATARIS